MYLTDLITLVKNSKKQLYEKNINLNFLTYCDDNLYQRGFTGTGVTQITRIIQPGLEIH
jgi:hypothetical protein